MKTYNVLIENNIKIFTNNIEFANECDPRKQKSTLCFFIKILYHDIFNTGFKFAKSYINLKYFNTGLLISYVEIEKLIQRFLKD